MNAMTARGLSLAVVVAAWTAISHFGKLPLLLWPVIIGLGCFIAAGPGIPGLQRSVAGIVSGVVWAMLFVGASSVLGHREIVDVLLLGVMVFGIVFQARVPFLAFTAGAIAGAGVALGVGRHEHDLHLLAQLRSTLRSAAAMSAIAVGHSSGQFV